MQSRKDNLFTDNSAVYDNNLSNLSHCIKCFILGQIGFEEACDTSGVTDVQGRR